MRRGFRCKEIVLKALEKKYEELVKKGYNGNYLKALENFDRIAENRLRNILQKFYPSQRSRDQAWKTCKGSLYEYAVFKHIKQTIISDRKLKDNFIVLMGKNALQTHKDQIVIKNWTEIFPDIDILLLQKIDNFYGVVKVIISCKTSLRERLTETAFWKRELEITRKGMDIKLVFITTDKDNELKIDTNRYVLLHVMDCTFVTDPEKYEELIDSYRKKYGSRKDFQELLKKVRFISEFRNFLLELLTG